MGTGDDQDFEAAWAEIVAELSSGPDALGQDPDGRGPDQDDHSAVFPAPSGTTPVQSAGPESAPGLIEPSAAGPAADPVVPPAQQEIPESLARLFEPLRPRKPPAGPPGKGPEPPAGARRATEEPWEPVDWQDEGHFVPPPPPDLPEGTPTSRFAWAGALGGPAILIGSSLTGYDLPNVVAWAAGLAAIAGFATLVWLLPDHREDSGWDDGAKL